MGFLITLLAGRVHLPRRAVPVMKSRIPHRWEWVNKYGTKKLMNKRKASKRDRRRAKREIEKERD